MSRDPLLAFLRDVERLYQVSRMYPAGHGQIAVAAARAAGSLQAWGRPVRLSLVGEDLVVEDQSVAGLGEGLKLLQGLLRGNGWEGVRVAAGCTPGALQEWVAAAQRGGAGTYCGGGIEAGRLRLEHGTPPEPGESAAWPEGYRDYLPDANQALAELGRADPAGLALARRLVGSISRRLAGDAGLLTAVRGLKSFDEYTFTHALNVSVLAMALGRRVGLPEALCELLGQGGLCHDLGKTRVPPEILNKPGRLSDAEKAEMDRHPSEGARLLLTLPAPVPPLLPVLAYQHHMGADRGGYPPAPNGRAPHPLALLVQVADVFDALRTVRPYRGTLSEVAAVNLLLADRAAGRLHDASVCALVGVLGILVPGARVRLADGTCAAVVGEVAAHRLAALVETDAGEIRDLSDPAVSPIAAFLEAEES